MAISASDIGLPCESVVRRTMTGSRKFVRYWIQSRWIRREDARLASSTPSSTQSTNDPVTRLTSSPSCEGLPLFFLACEMWLM